VNNVFLTPFLADHRVKEKGEKNYEENLANSQLKQRRRLDYKI
jgi:hypothetical protein